MSLATADAFHSKFKKNNRFFLVYLQLKKKKAKAEGKKCHAKIIDSQDFFFSSKKATRKEKAHKEADTE